MLTVVWKVMLLLFEKKNKVTVILQTVISYLYTFVFTKRG